MQSTPQELQPAPHRNPDDSYDTAPGANLLQALGPTAAYDSYWYFAGERQRIFRARLEGQAAPWSKDAILRKYRFTNAYRASDRVSQYLIRHVQYGDNKNDSLRDVVFRTLLFKIFNRIDTWTMLEKELGAVSWEGFDEEKAINILSRAMERGQRIYSAAYIMPAVSTEPKGSRKHEGHIRLLSAAIRNNLAEDVQNATSLKLVYKRLKDIASFGPFLAFQFAIDLNYSKYINHNENDFVVAGPGALDGISKCFNNPNIVEPEEVIALMQRRQYFEFRRLGIDFFDLWGRPLQLIDCQNLFCELSKYARVRHPDILGRSGRTRIKQGHRINLDPLPVWYPPKWGLNNKIPDFSFLKSDLFS